MQAAQEQGLPVPEVRERPLQFPLGFLEPVMELIVGRPFIRRVRAGVGLAALEQAADRLAVEADPDPVGFAPLVESEALKSVPDREVFVSGQFRVGVARLDPRIRRRSDS